MDSVEFSGGNMFMYCHNNPVNYFDSDGYLESSVLKIVNSLSATAIFANYATMLYTAFASTLVKISGYVTGILLPKISKLFWWKPWLIAGIIVTAVALVITAVSITQTKALEKSDSQVREKVKKNSPTQYWSADLVRGCVDIGRPLTYTEAVSRVAAGGSVFTVTSFQAEAVARVAGGNRTPLFHFKHENRTGYYNHYHIYGHANGGHV